MEPVVIIGTGLAGYTLAREIRKLDAELPLLLISADDGRAYSKPMLSNALVKDKTADQLAGASATEIAEQLDIRIETMTEIVSIDREDKTVHSKEDGSYRYSRLVLAMGADTIKLGFEGNAADDVVSINDLSDYARFRERLQDKQHILILGAGLIGCEFANDLLRTGYKVSVVDPGDQALARLLPKQCAGNLEQALSALGINWHFGTTADRIEKTARGLQITLSDNTRIEADLVISAVGLKSRIDLASSSGLNCNRGILVDRYLNTNDTDIFALGDCAEIDGLVLPFVMPIMHAARALAKTLTGEITKVTYPAMPVVVKTPNCPVVIAPPAGGKTGHWHIDTLDDSSTRARYLDNQDRLLGFALTGTAVSEKQSLTKALPPVLG